MKKLHLEFQELTPERWADFEELFGARGACGGCWCMWWRLSKSEFDAQKGEGNRLAMKTIVETGLVPGILAFHKGRPVGWCSFAPREEFPRLDRSRTLKPVDDQPVWSVVCFFAHKEYRRKGVSTQLLQAAVDYIKEQGGKIVEGYAIEPDGDSMPDLFAYHGPAEIYRALGFKEVKLRSQKRPIMRYLVSD